MTRTIERLASSRALPWLTTAIAALAVTLCASSAMAAPEAPAGAAVAEYDNDAPDEDYVWEDAHEQNDGTVIPGYYRVRTRPGFTWVPARYADGRWVRARWTPVAAKADHVWVPGHIGKDGYWVAGHWRRVARPGFTWVPAATVKGVRMPGFWRPAAVRKGHVWVPGHRRVNGTWAPGHWRVVNRPNYVWKPGVFRYGRWAPGFWKPVSVRAGHVWVPGHFAPRGWVPGHWRMAAKPGHHWVAARWVNGVRVPGKWIVGPRPARRFRVHRVTHMRAKRATHRRLWRNGERQRRHGKRVETRGKTMKAVGKATGNKRLERKGKKVEHRGKRIKRRGKAKKRVAR